MSAGLLLHCLQGKAALQDQWELGILVRERSWRLGVFAGETLEQCFNAWKIGMSGWVGEEDEIQHCWNICLYSSWA